MQHAMPNITLDGTLVHYTLQLSKRRSVGFLITDNGLLIRAPHRISTRVLEDIIQGKKQWLLKKLQAWQAQQSQWASLDQLVEDGCCIPILGQLLNIEYRDKPRQVDIDWGTRRLFLPTNTPKASLKLGKHLQQLALAHFQEVARQLGQGNRLGEFTIHLSSPKHRWGSCNNRREIRLNWRLIHYPPRLIEYVVAHELAHLVHMNHSAKFWATVEQILPGYEPAHKALAHMNPGMVPIDLQFSLS